ncbi:hypothetical protein ABTM95_19170, partial [Acinetobacter baumannii]
KCFKPAQSRIVRLHNWPYNPAPAGATPGATALVDAADAAYQRQSRAGRGQNPDHCDEPESR